MTTPNPQSTRPRPPLVGGEREQLDGFLDFHRATVVLKAGGLTDEQARRQLVPSELTTVAGLVAHLTWVEEWWFDNVIAGRPDRWKEAFDTDQDAEFRVGARTPLPKLIEEYGARCQQSRDVLAARALDDEVTAPNGKLFTVRWIVIHMIEETARHAGHLDLLREMLDGSTGQ